MSRALFISQVWPEPESSAASLRTLNLFQHLKNLGFTLHVGSACADNNHRLALEALGIHTQHLPLNDSAFNEYLKTFRPEFVFFDRFMSEEQFSWRVRKELPQAIRILDTIELHCLTAARSNSGQSGVHLQSRLPEDVFFSEIAARELGAIFRSDLSLFTSTVELEILSQHLPDFGAELKLLRPSYQLKSLAKPFSERQNFVCLGNFRHQPNIEGLTCLRENIWPLIRSALPQAELHIWGSYLSPKIARWDEAETGFRIKGRLSELSDLGNYKLLLAAQHTGAGIKGKLADAWSYGTPCVATEIAAEAMQASAGFGGIVAGSSAEFAQAAIYLYSSSVSWLAAQERGTESLQELFNFEVNQAALKKSLESAQKRKAKGEQSILNNLLWHHSQRSTEFFSRWLESKHRSSQK